MSRHPKDGVRLENPYFWGESFIDKVPTLYFISTITIGLIGLCMPSPKYEIRNEQKIERRDNGELPNRIISYDISKQR